MGGRRALVHVVALAGFAAACEPRWDGNDQIIPADDAAPADARFMLHIRSSIAEDAATPIAPLHGRIEGVDRTTFERDFADRAEWDATTFRFELLDRDTIVDTYDLDLSAQMTSPDNQPCPVGASPFTSVENRMWAFDHGELRLASIYSETPETYCGVLDVRHIDRCSGGCESTDKCGISYAAGDQRYSRVECVHAGAVATGNACTWQSRPDGRWIDDCAANSICVSGTCRDRCDLSCSTGFTCTRVPRAAPEISACVPS